LLFLKEYLKGWSTIGLGSSETVMTIRRNIGLLNGVFYYSLQAKMYEGFRDLGPES
jgi:hypothetical protein